LDDILELSIITGSDCMRATSARINKKWGRLAELSLYHSVDLPTFKKAVAFLQTMVQPGCGSVFNINLYEWTRVLHFGFDAGQCDAQCTNCLRDLLQQALPRMLFRSFTFYFSESNPRAIEVLAIPGIRYPAIHTRMISTDADIKTVSIFINLSLIILIIIIFGTGIITPFECSLGPR